MGVGVRGLGEPLGGLGFFFSVGGVMGFRPSELFLFFLFFLGGGWVGGEGVGALGRFRFSVVLGKGGV